ncbi:MAG: CPXCG motif-containing cysteine-rich protein [Gammaproteobacteria bacterium]|nr:CPXCG motif-containing cysteine-rich protein [Gammaproteobacteria bacterium]
MLESCRVSCPYCGESFEATLDLSAGSQHYIEDCYICCRPILFFIEVDHTGELISIHARRDDE